MVLSHLGPVAPPPAPAPPLLRTVSESALAHLIRAQPLERPPLSRVAPRSPHLASWCSAAEQVIVEDELHSLLKGSKVSERRQRIYRNAAAIRDYEAGRSPPASTKTAQKRAAMLLSSFDKNVEAVREKASSLVPSDSQQSHETDSFRSTASYSHVPSSPFTVSGGAAAGDRHRDREVVPPLNFQSAPSLHPPLTPMGAQPQHASSGSAAPSRVASRRPSQNGSQNGSQNASRHPSQHPSQHASRHASRQPSRRGSRDPDARTQDEEDDAAASPHSGSSSPGPALDFIAPPDLKSIRSAAEKDFAFTRAGHLSAVDRRPQEAAARLEVMPNLQAQEAVRAKARASLHMSETLHTRGSLQRRDLLPAAQQSESMKYALLSPRDEKGSNKKRRQRASANASSASATETTDANGKVANPYAQMYSMTNKEAAAAAAAAEAAAAAAAANRHMTKAQAHDAALENLHSATLDASPAGPSPGAGYLSERKVAAADAAAEGGGRSGYPSPALKTPSRARAILSREGAVGEPPPAVKAPLTGGSAFATPSRRVNFAGADGGNGKTGGGGATHGRRAAASTSERAPAGHSSVAEPGNAVWQVARLDVLPDGDGAVGPNDEVESRQLRSLPRDSLIWTSGLHDWLPLGPLPPFEALPPPPMP